MVGSDGAWLDDRGDLTSPPAQRRPGEAAGARRRRPRRAPRAGAAAGEVRTFAYQPPKLSELFMAAVARADAAPVAGGRA